MATDDTIRQQLSAYIDGELTAAERADVEVALAADADLRAEAEQLRKVRSMVNGLSAAKPEDDFVARVMEAAERKNLLTAGESHESDAPGRFRRVRKLAAAAVFVLAAGVTAATVVALWKMPDFSDLVVGENDVAVRPAEDESAEPADAAEDEPVTLALRQAVNEPAELENDAPMGEPVAADVSAKQDESRRSDRMAISAAAGGPYETLASAPAADSAVKLPATQRIEIRTDNLSLTQMQVENALLRNNIQPVASEPKLRNEQIAKQSQVFRANTLPGETVQYVALVSPQQADQLQRELLRIRRLQRISQTPVGRRSVEDPVRPRGPVATSQPTEPETQPAKPKSRIVAELLPPPGMTVETKTATDKADANQQPDATDEAVLKLARSQKVLGGQPVRAVVITVEGVAEPTPRSTR